MNRLLRLLARIVNILALCGALLMGLLGAVYELFGPVRFEEIAAALGISMFMDSGRDCPWTIDRNMPDQGVSRTRRGIRQKSPFTA